MDNLSIIITNAISILCINDELSVISNIPLLMFFNIFKILSGYYINYMILQNNILQWQHIQNNNKFKRS